MSPHASLHGLFRDRKQDCPQPPTPLLQYPLPACGHCQYLSRRCASHWSASGSSRPRSRCTAAPGSPGGTGTTHRPLGCRLRRSGHSRCRAAQTHPGTLGTRAAQRASGSRGGPREPHHPSAQLQVPLQPRPAVPLLQDARAPASPGTWGRGGSSTHQQDGRRAGWGCARDRGRCRVPPSSPASHPSLLK